jgi:NADH dehydrogenase/NADH:ubiquinone oxidoreductase subunit G
MDLIGFINEANPRARETAEALEGGAQLGVSIGARIKDYEPRDKNDPLGGWIINDVELKEASIVGMPANPRTWVHYATKAINGFERKRVKEAADMNMTATEVASRPSDESILDTDADTLDLIGSVEVDTAKVLTTETMPGGPATAVDGEDEGMPTFDGDPVTDEDVVEAADDAATEEPAQETESPEVVAESETPAEVLASAVDSSVEELSVTALRTALKVAKDELTARDESIAEITKERDAALATLTEATAILNKLATTPLGRKAVYTEAVKDYRSRITGVYDPEFMKFLKGPESK